MLGVVVLFPHSVIPTDLEGERGRGGGGGMDSLLQSLGLSSHVRGEGGDGDGGGIEGIKCHNLLLLVDISTSTLPARPSVFYICPNYVVVLH